MLHVDELACPEAESEGPKESAGKHGCASRADPQATRLAVPTMVKEMGKILHQRERSAEAFEQTNSLSLPPEAKDRLEMHGAQSC